MNVLVKGIGQLLTLSGVRAKDGRNVLREDLGIVEDAALGIRDGQIVFAGKQTDAPAGFEPDRTVDARGAVVCPGFVDPHTHPVFGGSRHQEFEMRSEGATYLEISDAGGGIASTVASTRKSTDEELFNSGLERLRRMLALGVTTVEAKSGYGLDTETELRMLRAIARASAETPQRIVPTFLGAHAVPPEYKEDPDRYVALVCEEMIPAVARENLASFCDVFCEKGFFDVEQSRRILETARNHGMAPKLHADEFEDLGGALLAVEVGAASADHLMAISDQGIAALAEAGTTAVLLPGTSVFLGAKAFAPARRILDAGVPVALSTDFNPGSCYTENLQLIATLACTCMGMSVAETYAAITYNAARALLLEGELGTLEPGMRADLVFLDIPSYPYLPYHMGVSFVSRVIIDGNTVWEKQGD